VKAIWKGRVLAQSDDTVIVDGNHYFPPSALNMELFAPSAKTSVCSWKGEASYYDVMIDGETNHDAAWYYPDPKAAAAEIRGRVAFWRGVTVEE
jgi:uncharacterized protein (DUF427 family)